MIDLGGILAVVGAVLALLAGIWTKGRVDGAREAELRRAREASAAREAADEARRAAERDARAPDALGRLRREWSRD